ncbi:stomatin-like protein 1 [Uloborus diversus]|uniref:stomatin-like protein 1 n=1 Tax=Uloborus diversus TaxID=327109 RepID=UPI002409AC36|nr:stomatin-like protein 1 [Uloborus diversus]
MESELKLNSAFDFHSAFEYSSSIENKNKFNKRLYASAFSYRSVYVTSDVEKDDIHSESQILTLLRSVITAVLYFFIISLFPLSLWICVKKVHALERLVLIRLGHLQPIRGPGYTIVLPFADVWIKIDLRPQVFTVSTLQLLTSDGGIIEAEADVEYHVVNAISYFTKLNGGENTLENIAQYCLKNMLSGKNQEDILSKREIIGSDLKDELNNSAVNWGLEVSNVSLHSIKVIKPGEPVDAIGTLMTALNAVTGHSSQHTAAMFPFTHLIQGKDVDLETLETKASIANTKEKYKTEEQTANKHEMDDSGILMQQLVERADTTELKDLTVKLKFDVTGPESRVIYCFLDKGKICVFESTEHFDSDVKLTLSENILKDILNSKLSPLDAYMDGQVKVAGDWTLLNLMPKLFHN